MKKVLFMLVAGAFMSTSMISCNKCGECDNSGVEYCQKDSKTLYDAAKTACTASGGSWSTK
jgi:hypothetical protein